MRCSSLHASKQRTEYYHPRAQGSAARRVKCSVMSKTSAEGAPAQAGSEGFRPTEWFQKVVELPPYKRGCHVITNKLYQALPELSQYEMGLAHFFIQHTSASLTINENASPDVPLDLNDSLDRIVPEGNQYRHLDEGYDDMPAHVKSSLMGVGLTVPISSGRLALGTWQGIYLNEHRNHGGSRRVMVTVQGVKRGDGRCYR